jgi:hypothetical protein
LGKGTLAWKGVGSLQPRSVQIAWFEVAHPAFIANNVVGTIAALHLALHVLLWTWWHYIPVAVGFK